MLTSIMQMHDFTSIRSPGVAIWVILYGWFRGLGYCWRHRMSHPIELIDEARLLELTETLVSIPSVTNNENEISDWIRLFQFSGVGGCCPASSGGVRGHCRGLAGGGF